MWRSFIYKCEFIKVKDMMTLEDIEQNNDIRCAGLQHRLEIGVRG